MDELGVGNRVKLKSHVKCQDFEEIHIPEHVFDEVYENGVIVEFEEETHIEFTSPNSPGHWLCPKVYFEHYSPLLPEELFKI